MLMVLCHCTTAVGNLINQSINNTPAPPIAGAGEGGKHDDAKVDSDFAAHSWNINNLPRNRGSTLRYLAGNELITGVQVYSYNGQLNYSNVNLDNCHLCKLIEMLCS